MHLKKKFKKKKKEKNTIKDVYTFKFSSYHFPTYLYSHHQPLTATKNCVISDLVDVTFELQDLSSQKEGKQASKQAGNSAFLIREH